MIETIWLTIIAAIPSITSIIGIIAAVVKLMGSNSTNVKELKESFDTLRDEIHESKEMEEVKNQLRIVNQENIELKQKLKELILRMDHIGGE